MKKLPNHIVRLVTFLVALQILSMGCFVQEFEPLITSDVTPQLNIINTIDEYIAEVVFNHKDAVPEVKENSKKDIQVQKHTALKLISISKPVITYSSPRSSISHTTSFSDTYRFRFFRNITPPPPKQTV